MFLKIDSITFDEGLYPRNGLHWGQVQRYSEAIKTGSQFPPVVVGKNGELVLIDGWHRMNAYKRAGEEKISAIITKAPKALWYAEAVRLNIRHGIALSMQERLEACMRLKKQGLEDAEIEKITAIPCDEIEKAVLERGHWEKGAAKPTVIKQPLVAAAKERGRAWLENESQSIQAAQKPLADSTHLHLLLQSERMLLADLLPRDEETVNAVKSLKKAVNKWLSV
jgi:hypothetical protein